MVLKACEVIPKKIENPLLFGKITSYIFMCLSIAEGTLLIVFIYILFCKGKNFKFQLIFIVLFLGNIWINNLVKGNNYFINR